MYFYLGTKLAYKEDKCGTQRREFPPPVEEAVEKARKMER